MKGLSRMALAMLVIAACGRDGAVTAPDAPGALPPVPGVFALGVDSMTGASIQTNLDDYMPGEVVHVVGRGWAPGETVRMFMTENPDTHDDVTMDVVADGTGAFSVNYYDVQTHDLGVTFTLRATGLTSNSVAIAVFTDGRPVSLQFTTLQNPTPVPAGSSATFGFRIVFFGSSDFCTVNLSATPVGSPAWPAPPPAGFFSFAPSSVRGRPGVPGVTQLTVNTPAGMAPGTYHYTLTVTGNPQPGDVCNEPSGFTSAPIDLVVAAGTVTNAPPNADAGGPYTVAEGSPVALNGTGSSDSDGTIQYAWTFTGSPSNDAGANCLITNANLAAASITCNEDGLYSVKLTVTDDDGASDNETVLLTVTNARPTANAGGAYAVVEGSSIQLNGSGDDPGNNDDAGLAFAWTVDDTSIDAGGDRTLTGAATATPSVTCNDDGNFKVSLVVSDDDGGSSVASTVNLTIGNASPSLALNSSTQGQSFSGLTGPIPVSAAYGDAGSNDTHQCQLELDGALDAVVPYFAVTGGTCSGSIVPPEAGIYTLTVRVKDDDNDVRSESFTVVSYDLSAGFVTGGGWIQSAAGAYGPDLTLSGNATFAFDSKYNKGAGATAPTGTTEFQFHAGGMDFQASSFQWLVVNQAGTTAQFAGTGTINGQGSYTFMLWAMDGGNTGDTFRVQITNNNGGATVYDNGVNQLIDGGSIVIHTAGKK